MPEATPSCARCGKPTGVCICDRVQPVDSRLRIVILQHPQEDDALLGTAKLVTAMLPKAEIRVGLSWASLEHALDLPEGQRDKWAVLSAAKLSDEVADLATRVPVLLVDRKGEPRSLGHHGLHGILVLDGTWSQAKTLWWRNPWLLKLPRLVLNPREPSMYGKLRREPRREFVSTLEAIADVLPALGEPESTRDNLRRVLRTMLQRVRDQSKAPSPG
jgi:DTW domain-containing protein YfiP